MNLTQYRQRLRELHPDQNGGDHSRVAELMQVQRAWREANTYCACGCQRKLSRHQINRKRKYALRHCARLVRARNERKPKKITTMKNKLALALSLLLTLSAAAMPPLDAPMPALPEPVTFTFSPPIKPGATRTLGFYASIEDTDWKQFTSVLITNVPQLVGFQPSWGQTNVFMFRNTNDLTHAASHYSNITTNIAPLVPLGFSLNTPIVTVQP